MTKSEVLGRKSNFTSPNTDRIISESGSKFTAKVFLYMFIAIAITAVVTILGASWLTKIFTNPTDESIEILTYIVTGMLVCFIPLFIWIQISVLRGGKGLAPAFVIYSLFVGAILAPIIALIQAIDLIQIVGIAFGITCGVFAILALIAWNTKKDISNLRLVGYGFLLGALFISLASTIVYFIFGQESAILSALVSGGLFIFVILITLVDLFNIRQIAARGEGSSNLAMVCAFSLYTDFVYIFVRILMLILRLAIILGKNK